MFICNISVSWPKKLSRLKRNLNKNKIKNSFNPLAANDKYTRCGKFDFFIWSWIPGMTPRNSATDTPRSGLMHKNSKFLQKWMADIKGLKMILVCTNSLLCDLL